MGKFAKQYSRKQQFLDSFQIYDKNAKFGIIFDGWFMVC